MMDEGKELNKYEKTHLEYCKMWALSHGLIHRPAEIGHDYCTFVPFCLYPTPVPRNVYNKALDLQIIFNEIYHRVATDREFLRCTLKASIETDDFIRHLWEIYENTDSNTVYRLGIFRNDFMLSKSNNDVTLKQVEFNTISVSFVALSDIIARLHNGYQENAKDIGRVFSSAWKLYNNPKAIIVFVVMADETNISDHLLLQDAITEIERLPKIRRLTLSDIGNRGVLDETQRLWIDSEEIALVYFRTGYDPKHYPTDLEWRGRKLIELSVSIKSPSVDYQLAGCKRIQAELCKREVLKRFISDDYIEEILNTFVSILSFDDELEKAKKIIKNDPSKWILKPQREGGGHNVYGDDIVDFLDKANDQQLRSFIAMERIIPHINKNVIVRTSKPVWSSVVSELGIFGAVLSKQEEILENQAFGSLLRTKDIRINEGGVVTGASALDSVKLYDCI